MALQANPLKELHTYRKILGVIGICHCPAVADIRQAYAKFEQACRYAASLLYSKHSHNQEQVPCQMEAATGHGLQHLCRRPCCDC